MHEEGEPIIRLKTPLSREDVTLLRAGDEVLLSGRVFTARDVAHAFLLKSTFARLGGSVIFHCGPIVAGGKVISAGPTTSDRMGRYMPALMEKYGIRAVIGKGGMDGDVLESMRGRAVYLAATGGTAALMAQRMRVVSVHKREFGMTEAIWELEVKDLPLTVAMDSHGGSLYKKVREESGRRYEEMMRCKGKP